MWLRQLTGTHIRSSLLSLSSRNPRVLSGHGVTQSKHALHASLAAS